MSGSSTNGHADPRLTAMLANPSRYAAMARARALTEARAEVRKQVKGVHRRRKTANAS